MRQNVVSLSLLAQQVKNQLGEHSCAVFRKLPLCAGLPSKTLKDVSMPVNTKVSITSDVLRMLSEMEDLLRANIQSCLERIDVLSAVSPLGCVNQFPGMSLSKKVADRLPLQATQYAYDQHWLEIAAAVRTGVSFSGVPENNVFHALFATTDQEFLNIIDASTVNLLDAEVAELTLARLRHIHASTPLRPQKVSAARAVRMLTMSLYQYTPDTLFNELMKMRLYQTLTGKDLVFLGSSRPVTEYAKTHDGYYLNCPEDQYSWTLNRLFLNTALIMGVIFQVVDRMPALAAASMESLSLYVSSMAHVSTRLEADSQYAREEGTEPTATMQEMLLLIGAGAHFKPFGTSIIGSAWKTSPLRRKRRGSFSILSGDAKKDPKDITLAPVTRSGGVGKRSTSKRHHRSLSGVPKDLFKEHFQKLPFYTEAPGDSQEIRKINIS